MNDVNHNTQANVTHESTQDAPEVITPKALEETAKKLIARKEGIKKMRDSRAIIRLRVKLDESMELIQNHLKELSELGLSEDPLEAFEGVSEQKRWKDYLEKLQGNRNLLLERVTSLIKTDANGKQ